MIFFDSHAHLQDEAFAADWRQALDRAAAAGVGRVLLPSTNLEDSRRAIKLASQDARLYCAVGCHPHEAASYGPADTEGLQRLAADYRGSPVVAIGETGLDYHYDFSPRPVQQAVFRQQLDLAFECRLPLIIHEREATADCLQILQQQAAAGRMLPSPGVFHCFSGSPETAVILLELGFYIGVDGPVTFKNARKNLEVIRHCPHDRLLLETDSPYLTPVPYRGQRNEPAHLPLIAAIVAAIWGQPLVEVARITTANACRVFGLILLAG
jgi:TatD DNase family protein